ncbi:MAG: helix-turn-helix transcriptional regulator [Chloroflexi bacterium]|nr:helix-turn-helix transcriptional regulator [Chloroflexota bacterium]
MSDLVVTQEELASFVGCSQSDISKFKDDASRPSIGQVALIAEHLRLPFSDLVREPCRDRLEYLLRHYVQYA